MNQLDYAMPPFDVLTPTERQTLKKHSQIHYLAKGDALDISTPYFYVLLKGRIEQSLITTAGSDADTQSSQEQFVSDFNASAHSHDWFDSRRQPDGSSHQDTETTDSTTRTSHYQYHASEDTLLMQIDTNAIDSVVAQNHLLRQLLSGDLSERVKALSQHQRQASHVHRTASNQAQQAEAQQLMLQPVTHIPLLPVHLVDDSDNLHTAAKLMTDAGLKHVLVRRTGLVERHPTQAHYSEFGILTDADICRSVSQRHDPDSTLCRDYAKFKLRTVAAHQDISEALLTMIRHRVHRLPVLDDDGQILGVLGQTDLLAYLNQHSQLISVQIDNATDVDSLHQAVEQIGQYIRAQQQNGIKIGVISRMVQTLNAQVFTKLWRMLVPEMVFENTCVIVMGSEGRGEQIMRTDQDNALIIRNGFNHPDLGEYAEQFNQALAQMGYPLCDGNIMMNNDMWRQSLSRFEKQISSWFAQRQPESNIWLAAVLDASYVCGDESLLTALRKHMQVAYSNADPMFVRKFASAALQFGEVSQWWQKFAPLIGKPASQDIDLKKAGLFPLVHGIRALALENHLLDAVSSKARLKALVRAGAMNEKRAETLLETLEFFMAQRLAVALITEDKHARQVDPTTLSALERDLMKDCLNNVKSFKNELRQHYQLQLP